MVENCKPIIHLITLVSKPTILVSSARSYSELYAPITYYFKCSTAVGCLMPRMWAASATEINLLGHPQGESGPLTVSPG